MIQEEKEIEAVTLAYKIQTKATSEMERFGKLLCLDPIGRARVAIQKVGDTKSAEDIEADRFFGS